MLTPMASNASGKSRFERIIDTAISSGEVLLFQSFAYDELGRIVDETVSPEPTPYEITPALMTYDLDDRVSSWQSGIASLAPTFDDDGNMTAGPLNGLSASFTYDSRNRLTAVGSTSYTYDAEDRRIAKTEGAVTTAYVHDPHAPFSQLLEKTTAGQTSRYVYANGQLIYEETPSGSIRVYHFDSRGSTRAVSDASGAVISRITYGTYGELVDMSAPIDTPFLYNGAYGVLTDGNGLLHMRARYYSPELRRFINADPIGFAGGMNWYAFAGGNPVMMMDPLGLFGWRDALGFVPVVGSALDAADSFKDGNWGQGLLHTALAVTDLTGAGAIAKGVAVGTMKIAARKAVKNAYKDTDNWDAMRRQLQKADVIPTNTMQTPRPDWQTTDHIFVKQRYGLPHSITNHPANLQTGVTQSLNSRFEHMRWYERAQHLPTWMKLGAAGTTSYGIGLFYNANGNDTSTSKETKIK